MYDTYYDDNAINVHMINSAPDGGSERNPGNLQYLNNKGASTFAHELGHNLGLEHTHNGNKSDCKTNNDECNNCKQEPVSRSMNQPLSCLNLNNKKKCEVNGDYLCDTAGEPRLSGQESAACRFVPSNNANTFDNWGARWFANPRNIMSYARSDCRTQFSYGQVGVMLDELGKNRFDFHQTSAQYAITGPNNVCPGIGYTFSVPQLSGVINYQWQIPNGWSISGQGTRHVTITPVENYEDPLIYVNIIPVSGSGGSVAARNLNVIRTSQSIIGLNNMPERNVCYSYYVNVPGASNYNWYTSSTSARICSGQGTSNVRVEATGSITSFYLNVSMSACGRTLYGSRRITVNPNGGGPIRKEVTFDLSEPMDEIEIYPNPTTSKLIINVPIGKELTNFSIRNMSGQTLLCSDDVFGIEEFDVAAYPVGVYIISYYDPEEGFISRKFRKN